MYGSVWCNKWKSRTRKKQMCLQSCKMVILNVSAKHLPTTRFICCSYNTHSFMSNALMSHHCSGSINSLNLTKRHIQWYFTHRQSMVSVTHNRSPRGSARWTDFGVVATTGAAGHVIPTGPKRLIPTHSHYKRNIYELSKSDPLDPVKIGSLVCYFLPFISARNQWTSASSASEWTPKHRQCFSAYVPSELHFLLRVPFSDFCFDSRWFEPVIMWINHLVMEVFTE